MIAQMCHSCLFCALDLSVDIIPSTDTVHSNCAVVGYSHVKCISHVAYDCVIRVVIPVLCTEYSNIILVTCSDHCVRWCIPVWLRKETSLLIFYHSIAISDISYIHSLYSVLYSIDIAQQTQWCTSWMMALPQTFPSGHPNLGPSTTTQHPLILSISTYPNAPITFTIPPVFIPHLNLRVKTGVFSVYPRYSPYLPPVPVRMYSYRVCNIGYWPHEQKPEKTSLVFAGFEVTGLGGICRGWDFPWYLYGVQ